jgi:hypothetical protein
MRAGDLVVEGGKKLIGKTIMRPFTRTAPPGLHQAYERQGVTPMPGAVSGRRPVQIMEHALSYTPGGSSVMQDVSERTVEQTGQAAAREASRWGGRGTAKQTGQVMREAAGEAGERFAKRREVLDAEVERLVGRDTPVTVGELALLRGRLKGEMARAPRSLSPNYSRAIGELDNIMADAKRRNGSISFSALRNIRTRVGRELERPDVAGYRPGEDANMARLYGALAETIKRGAARSPEASRALAVHDRYVRMQRGKSLPILNELIKQKTDERVFEWAIQGADKGGSRIWKLRQVLRPPKGDPNEPVWDDMVSTVLTRMGQAKPGAQGVPVELLGQGDSFSPSTFLTNYSKLSPEAKHALFSGGRYRELRENLDDLVKITASMKDAESMKNTSGTARGLLYGSLIAGVGSSIATGSVETGMATVGGSLIAPYVAAKMLTNPKVVKWIASTRNTPNNPNGLVKHLGRLAVIAEAEPDIRDEIHQYLTAMRSYPGLDAWLGDRGPRKAQIR